MSDESLLRRSAVQLARMVADRAVSPVELTEAALGRVERLDGRLGSFATVDAEGAFERARLAEARAGDGDAPPFDGVPTVIKDLHVTKGLRTTFGTSSMANFVPDFDDEDVARLRAAGFVFLGKSNVPEFGSVPYTESELLGPARSPWGLPYSAGGSSGGAAAAVAAGLVPAAHGSDGGGSIRIPASCCGVFGFKPSRGRISSAPLVGEQIGGLSTAGPITRHVVDAAAMVDVMEGYVAGDPNWAPPPERPFAEEVGVDPGRLRIGLVLSTPIHTFDADAVRVAREAASLMERLGHEVEPFEPPIHEQLVEDFTVLWTTRVAAVPVDPETLERFNRYLYEQGSTHKAVDLVAALLSMQYAARAFVRAASAYDVLLCATLTRPPLEIGAHEGLPSDEVYAANTAYVGLTPMANITGQPAMSLPLGWSADGLPMGVQFIGRPADEVTLFRLAAQVEEAAGWAGDVPPLD